jgi:hypothetical protein
VKTYKMTVLELQDLMRESRPRGNESIQKCVNRATEVWKRISARVGCDYRTCRQDPEHISNPRFFMAEPLGATPPPQSGEDPVV